ncbi:hypothetical protein DPMN_127658 [Dreissena polymorpha]|uniref:G-protein coupled receptors family 1 profile domain-containing protein n=1 Tax=Dreissena polymorpha TaxID=45954 RepID=A0A9D4H1N0_DREPO|nr:hypothetical protein DPMN_127658 [Dreissena polymorpha]
MKMDQREVLHSDNSTYMFDNTSGIEGNHTSDRSSFWDSESLGKIAPVVLVMGAALIGNLVLLVSLLCKHQKRKRIDVFIASLAIADLSVALITMPSELVEAVFKQWVFGAFMCKLVLYLQAVTLSSTTFILTAMSIDSYQIIVKPLKSLSQRPNIKAKVAAAWAMAFLMSIPQVFIFVQVQDYDDSHKETVHYCNSAGYSAEWQRKMYFTCQTFCILVLPTGIMLYCYTEISKSIWKRGVRTTDNEVVAPINTTMTTPRMSVRSDVVSASRRKVIIMTLTIIIAYVLCLTPYFIICLVRIYSDYSLDLKNSLKVSQTVFMLRSALNPILYGLFRIRLPRTVSLFCSCFKQHHYNRGDAFSHKKIKKEKTNVKPQIIYFRRDRLKKKDSVLIAKYAAKEEINFKQWAKETVSYRPQRVAHST